VLGNDVMPSGGSLGEETETDMQRQGRTASAREASSALRPEGTSAETYRRAAVLGQGTKAEPSTVKTTIRTWPSGWPLLRLNGFRRNRRRGGDAAAVVAGRDPLSTVSIPLTDIGEDGVAGRPGPRSSPLALSRG